MSIKKRGQFYIVAALIIIIAVVGIATVSNRVIIKKTPQNIYLMSDVFKMNGERIIKSSIYNNNNVETAIEGFLGNYSTYLKENTQMDFYLVIIYGDINDANKITGKIYSRGSLGEVGVSFGGQAPITIQGGTTIEQDIEDLEVIQNTDGKTVTISFEKNGKSYTISDIRVLEDNNFIYVMTTSEDFNDYVSGNLPLTGQLIKIKEVN